MKNEKKAAHGGNIYKKARELGIAEAAILDFSANLSPLGIPNGVKQSMIDGIEGLIHYPDPDCALLTEAIADFDKVKVSQVLCGNGGADLLFRLSLALKPKKALLPVPTFVEYEEALKSVDTEVEHFYLEQDFKVKDNILDAMKEEHDFLVICNPNNPTGLLVERELLLRILDKAKMLGITVLVDECFLEIYPGEKEYTLKEYLEQYSNLIILKSFTKMYAIPGVRLGYVLSGNEGLLQKMKACGQAWSVSHIAQAAGVAALKEMDYRKQTIDLIEKENAFMKARLSKLPIQLYDGVANYLFFRVPGVEDLDKKLENHGIMIRNCSNYVNLGNDYFRVAVRSREDNLKLIYAMEEALTGRKSIYRGFGKPNGADSEEVPEMCKSCTVAGCGGKSEEAMGSNYLYYGQGKGKLHMSLGAAIRAAEQGHKVLMYQFVKTKKGSAYGKTDPAKDGAALKQVKGITKIETLPAKRFLFMLSEEEKEEVRIQNDRKLDELMEMAKSYDMLVLDEVLYAVEMGVLSEDKLVHWMRRKPCHLELVLTGRKPTERILAMAEFVTEIKKEKDNMETGAVSRLGIE